MRRLVGLVSTAALAIALVPRVAPAATLATFGASDFTSQLMLRIFGESSDARASFAAARGDRFSESPLRDLALDAASRDRLAVLGAPSKTFATPAGPRFASPAGGSSFDLAQTVRSALLRSNLRFSATPQSDASALPGDNAGAIPAFTAGQYQPASPVTLVSPQSAAFSLGPLVRGAAPAVAASSAMAFGENAPPGASQSSDALPAAARLGPLKFSTSVEGASLSAPSVGLSDSAYGAGANLDVRAGARTLTFGLSSNYERLTRSDGSGLTPTALAGTSTWQLPGSDAPLAVPNYADLSRLSVGAGVAVPVFNGLTLDLDYAADRMFGGYGLPGVANLNSIDDSYGGKLTFTIPHSTSTLSISARQLHYLDSLIPANTSTQTREDVNLTVKF